MNNDITVTLSRADWLELADFLSRKIGETVNPVPAMNLLQALSVTDGSILSELTERQARRDSK